MQKHKTTTRTLPCRLSIEEWNERASRLATVNQEIVDEESRQGEQKATMKARLSMMEAERQQLSGVVVRKEETRDVECDIWHYTATARVVTVRRDTGDEIENRPMSDAERQQFIPFEEPTGEPA